MKNVCPYMYMSAYNDICPCTHLYMKYSELALTENGVDVT